MATYLQRALVKLEEFEGVVPWMYVDTVGRVTVGVGLMLPDAAAAQRLPFLIAGRAASAEEIEAEFQRVDAMPMGRASLFYRKAGGPELPSQEISSLLSTVVERFEAQLRKALPGYDSMPDEVKMALIDMAYNLGPTGLVKGYPKMMQALLHGNWSAAAAACDRRGPGAARNQWTRQMLLTHVAGDLKAEADNVWSSLGYGALGAGASVWEWLRKRF